MESPLGAPPYAGLWTRMACEDLPEPATAVEFSPSGALLAVAMQDATVAVWDVAAVHSVVRALGPLPKPSPAARAAPVATALAWAPGEAQLFACYTDGADGGLLVAWDLAEGAELWRVALARPSCHVCVALGGAALVACATQAAPVLVDVAARSVTSLAAPEPAAAAPQAKGTAKGGGVAVPPRGDVAFVLDFRGRLYAVDLASNAVLRATTVPDLPQWPSLRVSADGSRLLLGLLRSLRVYSAESLEQQAMLSIPQLAWVGSRFAPDGVSVVGCSSRSDLVVRHVYLWNPQQAAGSNVQLVPGPADEALHDVTWHAARDFAVARSESGALFTLAHETTSTFAGPWYPPNYEVLDDNEPYDEPEDEFDVPSAAELEAQKAAWAAEAARPIDVGVPSAEPLPHTLAPRPQAAGQEAAPAGTPARAAGRRRPDEFSWLLPPAVVESLRSSGSGSGGGGSGSGSGSGSADAEEGPPPKQARR